MRWESIGVPTVLGYIIGTPDLTVPEALNPFARCCLDGAAAMRQHGYRSRIREDDPAAALNVARHAREHGQKVGCLTPYMAQINSVDHDARDRDIGRFAEEIWLTGTLGCPRVQVYAREWIDGSRQQLRLPMEGRWLRQDPVPGRQQRRGWRDADGWTRPQRCGRTRMPADQTQATVDKAPGLEGFTTRKASLSYVACITS